MGREEGNHGFAKGGQIARSAAGDQVSIHNNRIIDPNAAGIFQIVLDSEGAGDVFAFENLGGDRNPTAVADERHQFTLAEKFLRQ